MQNLISTPYWWQDAPPRRLGNTPPAKTDVVIVGGGFTGLNAAITLRRAGVSVVVLEAEAFGFGASGRNAGHVSSGVNLGKSAASSNVRSPLEGRLPPGVYDALKAEAAASFDHIEALMPQLPRDAEYRRSGRVVCAARPAHYTAMQAKSAKMTRDGTHLYPKDQQRLVIGTDLYHGVMTIDRAGQLHPGKYVQGLVDLAVNTCAVLCDTHRVSGISRTGTGWRVAAGNARVDCEKVFIATNGYSDALRPWMRRRVIPAASYIVVTDELPDGLIDELLPQGRTAVDSKRLLSYFRPTPDRKRILFGGRASLQERPAQEVADELAARLYAVFPQITGLPIRYAWSGKIAFTFDLLPHLGEHQGIVHALGCNGSGVAMQSYLGHMAGQAMSGGPKSAFWNLDFPTLPFYRETPWFLPAVTGWYRFRDAVERTTGL
ncbi:NAD(P)/FAD-dependent oxidoreductase [Pseudosulfitobacter pseudonitzschiae]|uniref:NAD(P)/FAD-dependent oxidoreductase n=1 Tax=Pseudosulfitobacter pseudonitzschiae TaxID=1402135 RepID=UPI001AFBB76C|nr:FAD-binding oxidoreductase [Pseudosulfitobacter pseudonitzschiae]MBM1817615.1 FAD-binding oxidoreductase [Pseudosulfitobacter pseudonitzschiae]MBM1834526.1 FAD-binding oxidoreductase [Pseudosulfitobacter pseudonitzschiae]MBM1839391.1 FAD-binding oxidoreductase [Pseudosulfitobacter pseudonitzschiae]MBM1844241.1 FAD-binding oxidoreductase [Pseudosulfitobacter pseudonitzschiae]MBM1849076.1 FAD-binding oxidoreductase [Pseudosulfitobacter pseudonitzschiae]